MAAWRSGPNAPPTFELSQVLDLSTDVDNGTRPLARQTSRIVRSSASQPKDMTSSNISNLLYEYYQATILTTQILTFGRPEYPWSTSILLWIVRIVTFSILLRTYLGPLVLRLASSRIRVRSVSLRSIRGIFFRQGNRTLRIERVSYSWSRSQTGTNRFTLKVDGFGLEIGDAEAQTVIRKTRLPLKLEFLNPKPLLNQLRRVYEFVLNTLDPVFRPFLRQYAVACMQLAIRWIPAITQAVSFEVHEAVVTFTSLPGAKVVVGEISLGASVEFIETEQEEELTTASTPAPETMKKGGKGMAQWSSRMRDGFKRSLDRAWGSTRGKGKAVFKIGNVEGTMPPGLNRKGDISFLSLPGTVQLNAAVDFNPRAGTIEPHSVDISVTLDMLSAKVDLLATVIGKLKPPPSRQAVAERREITPLNLESPKSSFSFPTPQFSAALQSALPSFASSMFSPASLKGPASAFSALSPRAANLLSPISMKSPSSPFFKAISSSMMRRPRRQTYVRPSTTLKEEGNISSLSIVKNIRVYVRTIKLSASSSSPFRAYNASIKTFRVNAGLADDSKQQFHHKWLGNRQPTEKYDPDTYLLSVSLDQIKAKSEQHPFPLLAIGAVTCNVAVHQWPAPLLITSPLMRGDPNAPFAAVGIQVASIQATQKLQDLRELMDCLPTTEKTVKPVVTDASPPRPLALPRIYCDVECGPISARLLYTDGSTRSQELSALVAKTNGFVVNLQSYYHHASPSTTKMYPAFTSVLPVEMVAQLATNIEPLSVHTCSLSTVSTLDFGEEDPTVFSAGAVTFTSTIRAIAETDGPGEGIAVMDKSSVSCQSHIHLDSISIELWNPAVVDSVHQFLSLVPARSQAAELPPPSPPRFKKPPIGILFTASLAQCVAFVTGPDINPNDTLELSRGLSFRTGVNLEVCSLQAHHNHWYDDEAEMERRARLLLPLHSVLESAIAASKTATSASQRNSAFVKVHLHYSVVKSLDATQYAPSEELIAERLDIPYSTEDFIRIRHIQLEASISSGTDGVNDTCNISAQIPSIRGDFKLSHVYSVLLAVQTLASLQARRSSGSSPKSKSTIDFHAQVSAPTVQVYWTLPKRNIVTRFDGLYGHASSTSLPQVGFSQARLFVPLPSRINRWETSKPGLWDELLNLQKWEATLTLQEPDPSVAVTGDNACLRIPSGFVFHDLIFDASVLAKALKHVAHITKAGRFWKFPAPEAEGPKIVPALGFRLGYFCIEVQDDPFDCKLNRIWQVGYEGNKQRMEREDAFVAKAAAVLAAEQQTAVAFQTSNDYQFNSQHTISIEEARQRLNDVHFIDWKMRIDRLKEVRVKAEQANLQKLHGRHPPKFDDIVPNLIPLVERVKDSAPLLRARLYNLNLIIGGPSFPIEELSSFLHTQGSGMPADTQFSLLIPMHIHFTLTALRVTLRDYPIPLLNVLPHNDGDKTAFTFDTDLVIAEEMGTDASTEWHECGIIYPGNTLKDESPWFIAIPKTIMPVKTYANPTISVDSPSPTILGWGVSYGPAIQDLMRFVDTLSSPPQDPSPVMGFWDKLRLIMHWTVDLNCTGDVHLYLKGSQNPYDTVGTGAGFVLAFSGAPRIAVGFENEQREIVQITSHSMAMAVPDMDHIAPNSLLPHVNRTLGIPKPFKKTWAKLNSGVRFGVGLLPERSCGPECSTCTGPASERACRFFTFKPHYEVIMETKPIIPIAKTPDDSYNGFRSDFVHMSLSLESDLKKQTGKGQDHDYSSLHLTPQLFAHFWSWCNLFEGGLPIRQGDYYPPKPISPKLGRHLATLKYRISIYRLYVMHAYVDDSPETWVDGVTSWVGVKSMVDELHVDMHQREEEIVVPGPVPGTTRIQRRKPFNAAEVVLKGLDMRALVASFENPLKKDIGMPSSHNRSNYRKHTDMPLTHPSSSWYDINDFIELDWKPHGNPLLHLIPLVTCPRFSYFKRTSATQGHSVSQKFGAEDSHICLLDKEPSAPRVQILLASARAAELRRLIRKTSHHAQGKGFDRETAEKMVALLEDYVTMLQDLDANVDPKPSDLQSYFLPSEIISPKEWAEFENVYQVHCPSISLNATIRDIILQYYYCSRARKGLEYHMAQRAVKFIRDQAKSVTTDSDDADSSGNTSQADTVNIAATAIRKILGTDKASVEVSRGPAPLKDLEMPDPLEGWAEGVSLRKSHCCLLLKPQFILRGVDPKDTCIVATSQAKLQSYAIMDILNLDDPVSGKIMSRNYTSVTGMQVYAPTAPLSSGINSIPLEVLIDLRCESRQFERLVPQTDASFHYDKFNRLRLRNKATLALARSSTEETSGANSGNHLQEQTDLIRVHIPRFTVSANTEHFQAISNVVTKLLLFSDAAHKTRLERLETMIFAYDFQDLMTASNVISNLQTRLRDAVETQQATLFTLAIRRTDPESERMSALRMKAHIFQLQEELSLLFDAIKLSQDRFDASAEQNNALLLHASSSEISWRMLDERRNLLAKLVVQDISFHWLNRQDSSTVNHLTVGNLTAFDGSRYAMWAEIISKYDEPANHPLLKKGLFCLARWTILAPVGGISIYENFELSFHPMRLQVDAKVGHRIMEYVWPARKERQQDDEEAKPSEAPRSGHLRASLDSPRTQTGSSELSVPTLRRLAPSRSFTDLRGARDFLAAPGFLNKNRSTDSLNLSTQTVRDAQTAPQKDASEAAVMKNRSTQKSFVFVRIASLNLLLSVSKEGSFECRDARIKTRDLEYRNQTWSFEELVNQFIPSNMSWKGWVKMAFHQPLLPVLPVAKELLAKTKWTASKSGAAVHDSPFQMLHPRMMLAADDDARLDFLQSDAAKTVVAASSSNRNWKNTFRSAKNDVPVAITPESSGNADTDSVLTADGARGGRNRLKSLLSKGKGPAKPPV